MERDVCLIVNPHAGGGRASQRLPAAEAAMRARGLRFRVERTTSLDHARELARGARDRGEVAAAMGGDGLMGAVAGELCRSDGVLGVLPGGRGNDFARKLGISEDTDVAVELIAAGATRSIDVAFAGDRAFLGIASAGLDSDVQVIANATRLPLGDLVYVYGTLRALIGWKAATWTVTLDGEERRFRGYAVAVANSGVFGGGMRLVPDASLEDGRLDVVLTAESSRPHFLRGLIRTFRGAHLDDPTLTFLQAREVSFHADRAFTAFADGDPIAALPATFRVVPRALRVLAP